MLGWIKSPNQCTLCNSTIIDGLDGVDPLLGEHNIGGISVIIAKLSQATVQLNWDE